MKNRRAEDKAKPAQALADLFDAQYAEQGISLDRDADADILANVYYNACTSALFQHFVTKLASVGTIAHVDFRDRLHRAIDDALAKPLPTRFSGVNPNASNTPKQSTTVADDAEVSSIESQ